MRHIAALLTGTFLLSLPLAAQAQSQPQSGTAAANAPAPAVAQLTTCSDKEKAQAQANPGMPAGAKKNAQDLCHAQNNGSPTPPAVEPGRR